MDRRPALAVAIEPLTDQVAVDPLTGERRVDYEMVYTEYDHGRIKAGYCCIVCGEAHEEAYPERCAACGFPMATRQAEVYAEQFGGYVTIGPSRSLAELRAEDEEVKARAAHSKGSQIWVP